MFYAACLCWRAPGLRTLCYMVSLAWNGKHNKFVEFYLIWFDFAAWSSDSFEAWLLFIKPKSPTFSVWAYDWIKQETDVKASRSHVSHSSSNTWKLQEFCRSPCLLGQVDECLSEGSDSHCRGSFQWTLSIQKCRRVPVSHKLTLQLQQHNPEKNGWQVSWLPKVCVIFYS